MKQEDIAHISVNAQPATNKPLADAVAATMAAAASKLPSPRQVVVAKPVSVSIMLGLFTLALLGVGEAEEHLSTSWKPPPSLETFSSYEDMQRYFDHRNQRRLRQIENPWKDSYIEAYNQHNEEEEHRTKRSAAVHRTLQTQPTIIKFEMSDAVEPSEEVKDLIRQYKSRELHQNEKYMETVPPSNIKNTENLSKPKIKRTPKNANSEQRIFGNRLNRSKRSVPQQHPPNFQVKYIPFEVTDAREPDAHTKNIIKRMRALEIEKLSKQAPLKQIESSVTLPPESLPNLSTTTKKPFVTKRSKHAKHWKPKRMKREAAAPEMIKFEIADAKNPDPSLRTFTNSEKRESKKLPLKSASGAKVVSSADTANSDLNSQDTKRYFVFKEAPKKVKKSIAAVPHDVQNIISHLIKGSGSAGGGASSAGRGGGKAYLKYIPSKQIDYNHLKAIYPIAKGGGASYGHGGSAGGIVSGGNYGKYAQAVPVKLVYHPVVVGAIAAHGGGYAGGGGGAHEGGGTAVALPVKYVALDGGDGGYGAAAESGHGSSYTTGGRVHGGSYSSAGGSHGSDYAAGGATGYIVAGGVEGSHGAGGYESGHGSGYVGGGGVGHIIAYSAGEESGYGAVKSGDAGSADVNGKGGYADAGSHDAGYGTQSHGDVHGGGVKYIATQEPAAIGHPIVVAEGSGEHQKSAGYGTVLAGISAAKSVDVDAIKAIPPPQFKGETKYSVVPTVEQYAKTPTQDFHLKLYSPESLIAKAQLIAKDQAKAIAEEGHKAVAAAYSLAAEKNIAGFGGSKADYGGGGALSSAGKESLAYEGDGGFGFKIGGGGGGAVAVGNAKGAYGTAKAEGGYSSGGETAATGPIIKIEYHAPAESYKGNYRDLPEFQQLSALVGKSPEDQIHGLTYLLAKEMQNRLHLQHQHNFAFGAGVGKGDADIGAAKVAGGYGGDSQGGDSRPQDNKAPVLFLPQEAQADGGKAAAAGGGGFYQPIVGKYIGMAKSKEYIPVIEQAATDELKGVGAAIGTKGGASDGGIDGKLAGSAYGLSANYKGLGELKGFAGGLGAKGAIGAADGVFNTKGYEEAAAKLQSYASKYAFGYRIRDFNTGNDFGHKQNRDLHGVTRGQYHILLPDGRIQNVIYHADDTGFHADVSFESGR